MEKVFTIVWAVFAILAGLYAALGARYESLPIHWKGSRKSVPRLSRLGFGLFFGCLGVMALTNNHVPKFIINVLLFAAVSGWILIGIGIALNARAESRRTYQLPGERRTMSNDERFGWIATAFGLLFISVIMWMILTH